MIMAKSKSSAAWPVGSLFAALALFLFAVSHDAPSWVYLVILLVWWVGFAVGVGSSIVSTDIKRCGLLTD
jgi:hypothetical protein